jgi:hypothetical protein
MLSKSKRRIHDPIAYTYSGQDGGASLPYFIGRQSGTGWLRNLARIAFPILKKVVGVAGNIASNTAEDLIENKKSFTESLKDNALNEAQRVLKGGGSGGGGYKRTSSKPINSLRNRKIQKSNTIFGKS